MGGILLVILLSNSSVFSQIKGKVSSNDGEPLIGVNISIKGGNRGTNTVSDGTYKIDVPKNSVLIFSYVGFISKEITINNQQVVDVILNSDEKQLSEVVVVGYGSQLKKNVTGSVQTIGQREIKDIPVSQIGQKLQGQLAGVQINQTTGKPGQGLNIRIRGQLSVSGGSDPLYVVDGFPITGSIGDLNCRGGATCSKQSY